MTAICPLCCIEYDSLLEANICRIGDLLKQLVDNSNQATRHITLLLERPQQQLVDKGQRSADVHWLDFPYKCMACRMGWATYEEADPHWQSGEHQRHVAMTVPTR